MTRAVWLSGILLILVAGSMGGAATATGLSIGDESVGATLEPVAPADVNTSERLVIADEHAHAGYANVSMDPIVATSMAFETSRGQFEAFQTQEAVLGIRETDDQMATSADAIEELRVELDGLYEAERAAYEAFAAAEIDATEFADRLVRNHNRAAAVDTRGVGIRLAIGSIDAPTRQGELNVLRGRLRRVQTDARTFQGPVGDRLIEWITGERSKRGGVWLASTDDGYEVAIVARDEYRRQSYVAPNRDRTGEEWFRDRNDSLVDVATFYPWAFEHAMSIDTGISGGLAFTELTHPQGTTVVYLDATSRLPFRDAHVLTLEAVTFRRAVTESSAGFTVSVEPTFAGGPTRVTIVDLLADERVEGASVRVGEVPVDETDEDGQSVFVAPARDMTVTVDIGETTIELIVPKPGA